MHKRLRTMAGTGILAISLGLLSGCAGLLGNLAPKLTNAMTTGATGGSTSGSTANGSTTADAVLSAAVTDLQQLSALSQLAVLGGSAGASALVSSSALTSSSAYSVMTVATASMTPTQLSQFNSQSGWNTGSTRWSFLATSGWFNLSGGSGGTFLGTETVTNSSGGILEVNPMRMDYSRNAGSSSTSWSGTDTMTETVASSSLRPSGTYVHVDQTDQSTDAAGDRTSIATESVSFTPAGGGAPVETQTVRDETQGADGSDQSQNTYSGTLPGGQSFTTTSDSLMGATYSFDVDAQLTIPDGHQVRATFRMTGNSNLATHGPASVDPTSRASVTLLKADGTTEASVALDTFTVDATREVVDTDGVIDDPTGAQVATFAGAMDIPHSTWSGIATAPDGSTRSIDFDALAQIINN